MSIQDGRTLPWRVFDRVIRPFSFAVSLATFVLTLGIATDNTVGASLDSGLGGVVIVAASFTTTALLWWGWWAKSTSLMAHGLLLAAAVWAAAGYVILLEGASWVSKCLALC